MSVSIEDVRYIAELARLDFKEEELPKISAELSAILAYMAKLDELSTENVDPMTHVLDLNNVYRSEEKAVQRISHDEALKNAPDADSEYFRVPKVIS